jgi:hypothetical protein
MGLYGLDWCGSGQGLMANSCEQGNERSGSIKCSEFIELVHSRWLLEKGSAPCVSDSEMLDTGKSFGT